MNSNWQKIGGWAALFEAFAYLAGFAFMLTVLQPAPGTSPAPAVQLAHVLGMVGLFKAWHVLIYVMFGAVLVVLVTALHEKLAAGTPPLMTVASAFGLIWAGLVIASGMIANVGLDTVARMHALDPQQATVAWQTLGAVQDGLGGGVELVGGLWIILLSIAALRQKILPRRLNYLGLIIGAAGILTIIPALKDLGALFGLAQIVWFIWLGMYLLTTARRAP
ncbi:MAG: DUF4386 family protein [Pseudomonadota bacterium]